MKDNVGSYQIKKILRSNRHLHEAMMFFMIIIVSRRNPTVNYFTATTKVQILGINNGIVYSMLTTDQWQYQQHCHDQVDIKLLIRLKLSFSYLRKHKF